MIRKLVLVLGVVALSMNVSLVGDAQAGKVIRRAVGIKLSQQPQYPKSMRKRGLKQLGAVPALGGVRSLSFWGGER